MPQSFPLVALLVEATRRTSPPGAATIVVAPLLRIFGLLYVLGALRLGWKAPALGPVFRRVEQFRPRAGATKPRWLQWQQQEDMTCCSIVD